MKKQLHLTQETSSETEQDRPEIQNQLRKMTFGEQLVGIAFNPAADDKVAKAKQLCADLADLLKDEMANREASPLSMLIEQNAYSEILNAQMNVVKALTLKY